MGNLALVVLALALFAVVDVPTAPALAAPPAHEPRGQAKERRVENGLEIEAKVGAHWHRMTKRLCWPPCRSSS